MMLVPTWRLSGGSVAAILDLATRPGQGSPRAAGWLWSRCGGNDFRPFGRRRQQIGNRLDFPL